MSNYSYAEFKSYLAIICDKFKLGTINHIIHYNPNFDFSEQIRHEMLVNCRTKKINTNKVPRLEIIKLEVEFLDIRLKCNSENKKEKYSDLCRRYEQTLLLDTLGMLD